MKIKFKNVAKKALALLCAFVMTATAVLASGTPENSTPEISKEELYTIELLEVLGIYDGVDAIEGKEAFVRRDVMAFLAARIMGISDATYQGESKFSDVDPKSFAYSAINILADMGIVKGNSDGTFEPTKDITLDEASEIILRIMGYNQLIEMKENSVCRELIQKHDLHDDITYAKDKRLQVKHLSALLYNALTADFPQIVYMSGDHGLVYRVEEGETLLSKTFGVYEVEGVIDANARTSVDVTSGAGERKVIIGDGTYLVGETDADKYVGYYVKAFYREGDENTLLCIDVESTNTVVVLSGEDIRYENFEYITYENDRRKEYKVSRGLNHIYNGKAIYYDEDKMVPEYGTVTLVNNNRDKAFDTVIVNSVRNLVVANYGTTSNIIQAKYGEDPIDMNKLDETMYSLHKADGKPYKLTSLKEWDVLSVVESEDGEYVDITVSNETVTGTIEKISNDNDKVFVTIDGTKYEVAETFYENDDYNLERYFAGTFYLDMFGRVAAANGSVSGMKWGYIIKVRHNIDADYDCLNIKMLTQDSSNIVKLDTSEKFYLNDEKCTNIEGLTINEYQVVRYSLDKEGKIRRLYTVGNEFVQMAARSSRGFVSNVFVQNRIMDIAVNSDTVFLQIPNSAAGDDRAADEFYGVMSLGNFVRDSWYTVTAYGFEEDAVVSPMVLVERFTSTAATPGGTYMVVSDVYSCLDKYGDPVEEIVGYDVNKNKVQIQTRSLGVAENFGIEKGDFFAMVLYPDGTLQRGVQVFDYQTGLFNNNYDGRDYNMTYFGRTGYAYDISSNYLMLSDSATEYSGRKVLNTSSSTVLIVDSNETENIVKIGSISDIKTLKQSGAAARIVFFGSNSVPRAIVCYQ